MNRHIEALTQAEQDRRECNGPGNQRMDIPSHTEPRCPICRKGMLIRKSFSVVQCLRCKEMLTERDLKFRGIKIGEIA